MRRFTVLAAVVVAALAVVGVAHAGNPDGLGPWADYVVAHNQGCAIQPPDINTCVSVPPSRTDPQAAVGPAESPAGPNQNIPVGSFYSLGFTDQSTGTAFITLGFDNAVCNQAGADLAIDVFEITQEPYPNETVNVYVSKDNVNYVFAGQVTKDGSVAMPASVPIANFVKLVDATPRGPFASTPIVADGFDLDGVRTLNTLPCDTGTGKIEICKATTNGMSGKLFQYSVNGGTPISVRGGRCSGPITSPAGAVRIVELQSDPPTDVTRVTTRPTNRLVLTDLPNRTAIVFVVQGSTAANETLVTFTNQPAGGNYGNLKICKLTQSAVYLGRGFSFSVNGGPLITTEASDAFADPSTYVCRLAGTFQVGTRVSVSEKLPAGAEVAWIDTDPGDRLLDLNTEAATAQVLIGTGVTTLLVDNEPIPPPQAGYIEICKDAALVPVQVMVDSLGPRQLLAPDPEVQGLFTFTVTPSDGNSFDVEAGVGQCTAAIQVAAGVVHVTEHPRENHTLIDASTLPEDRLLESNLINGTVAVEVPVSSSVNDETQVHFMNQRDRAQLKVCKALGPNSDALNGKPFSFRVYDRDSVQHLTLWPTVIASSAGTQCVIVGDFPVGDTVKVTENLDHDPGGAGEFIDTTGEGDVTIAPGVNTATIKNTAMGLLEICKAPIFGLELPAAQQPKFQFRLDGGGAPVVVQAGKCSQPIRVSVATHMVTELNTQTNYELDPNAPGGGITVEPADREMAKNLPNRTISVSVPYGTEGETVVTFKNRIKRGLIKICKVVQNGSLDALGTTDFTFTVSVNGGQPFQVGPISNGECLLVGRDFPILTSSGNQTRVDIIEDPVPGVVTTDITYQGAGQLIASTVCSRSTAYYLGAGVNISTFTNAKGVVQACGQ